MPWGGKVLCEGYRRVGLTWADTKACSELCPPLSHYFLEDSEWSCAAPWHPGMLGITTPRRGMRQGGR